MAAAGAASGQEITAETQNQLQMSYAGAAQIAAAHPQYADQIIAAARDSFLHGDRLAYTAGFVAVLLGLTLVRFFYPDKETEQQLHATWAAEEEH